MPQLEMTRMPDLTAVKNALRDQRIELPSWAFGNTGTRFKVFAQPGVPRTPQEKVLDAAQVHQFTGVAPSGPAAQAGLEVGDVITTIDGEAATSNDQLESLSLSRKAGDTVTISYARSGQTTKTTITLGSRPG